MKILAIATFCLAMLSCREKAKRDDSLSDTLLPRTFAKVISTSNEICGTKNESVKLNELSDIKLSDSFLNNCSGCHGTRAKGRAGFPSLLKLNSVASLKSVVRLGRGAMPAFGKNKITDQELEHDFKLWNKKPAALIEVDTYEIPISSLKIISDAEYSSTMRRGLVVWRKAGDRGACAACHGPDGIDLARIAYPNSAILRRALGQGLKADESIALVDMINAQRNRYQITNPCHPKNFRPFQPTGQSIVGTAAEKETQLLSELKKANIDFSSVSDETNSDLLIQAFKTLDPQMIAIGIELNRWTEDDFHGGAHKSTAEWISELPLEPKKEDERKWLEIQNKYLSDISDKNLWELIDFIPNLTAMRFSEGGVGERISKEKYKSVLTVQHMMRQGTKKLPDLKATQNLNRFPIWETAQIANVMMRGCAEDGSSNVPFPCWSYPSSFFKKMGTNKEDLLKDAGKLNLPWLVAGLLADPALQFTENGDAQMQHLHESSLTEARRLGVDTLPLHNIYFSFLRVVKSVDAMDESLPNGESYARTTLNGCWQDISQGIAQWENQTLPALQLMGILTTGSLSEEVFKRNYKSVMGANRAILYAIKKSLISPRSGCKIEDTARLKSVLASVGAFGLEAYEPHELSSNKALAAEIISDL